jgi:hypothetical protein
MDPVEPTDSLSFPSNLLSEAESLHLPPSDNPMLLLRQRSNRMIVSFAPLPTGRFRSA